MTETTLPVEGMGVGAYIAKTFTKPRVSFWNLPAQKPATWWVLLIALLSLIVAPSVLSIYRQAVIGYELALAQMAAVAQGAPGREGILRVDPNVAAPAGEFGAPPGPQIGPPPTISVALIPGAASVVGTLIGWAVWSLLLMFGVAIGGGRTSFSQLFKLSLTAALPLTLRGIMQVVYQLATAQPLGMAGLSGLVLPSPADAIAAGGPITPSFSTSYLGVLLGSIDVFQLWNYVLIVIGLSTLARMGMGRALVLVLLILLILSLIATLPVLLAGAFATA